MDRKVTREIVGGVSPLPNKFYKYELLIGLTDDQDRKIRGGLLASNIELPWTVFEENGQVYFYKGAFKQYVFSLLLSSHNERPFISGILVNGDNFEIKWSFSNDSVLYFIHLIEKLFNLKIGIAGVVLQKS